MVASKNNNNGRWKYIGIFTTVILFLFSTIYYFGSEMGKIKEEIKTHNITLDKKLDKDLFLAKEENTKLVLKELDRKINYLYEKEKNGYAKGE